MRALVPVLLLLATALSGCADNDADPDGQLPSTDGTESHDSHEMTEEGPPLLEVEDPWGEETEIDLGRDAYTSIYQGCPSSSAQFIRCYGTSSETIAAIPIGTETVRVEVESSELELWLGADLPGGEWYDGGSQSTPAAWEIPVEEIDWEEGQEHTALFVHIYGETAGYHQGSMEVQYTAVKDPEWVAVPYPDPWYNLPNLVTPNVAVLLDDNLTAAFGMKDFTGAYQGFSAILSHPIPEGTTSILLGASYAGIDCAPASECFLAADTYSADSSSFQAYESLEFTTTWTVLTFPVPSDALRPDGPDAEESDVYFEVYALQCDPVYQAYLMVFPSASCLPLIPQSTVDLRVRVEAWREEPDHDAFKERLGI